MVGDEEVDEGGGEDKRLIREGPELDGGGTGIGDGEQGLGSWKVSMYRSRSSIVMDR
jgi:hypothetical protein